MAVDGLEFLCLADGAYYDVGSAEIVTFSDQGSQNSAAALQLVWR